MHNSIDIKKNIGLRLTDARKEAGLSRKDLCDAVNQLAENDGRELFLNEATLKQWEYGNNQINIEWLPYLCAALHCDTGYIFGDYDFRTRSATDIVKETNLSPCSVTRLLEARQDASFISFLNAILESPASDLQKLAQAYNSYIYAKKVIIPVYEKNEAKLTGKRVYVDFIVNDKKSPSRVGIQEIGDYTEFNLLHSFLKVLEVKEK